MLTYNRQIADAITQLVNTISKTIEERELLLEKINPNHTRSNNYPDFKRTNSQLPRSSGRSFVSDYREDDEAIYCK